MVTEIPSTLCLLTVASLAALGWVFKDVLVKKADYVLDPQGAQSGGEVVKEAVGNGPWGGQWHPLPSSDSTVGWICRLFHPELL